MSKILPAIACNLDKDLLAASYPLLDQGRVEGLEWSFDALDDRKQLPPWFEELLHEYSRNNRLIGHGIYFSLFSGKWSNHQDEWLSLLKSTSHSFPFDHVTEHFGFMTGKDFHSGAPLPIPYTQTTLQIGRDRLRRIQDAAGCPVGLENLAFSYSSEQVKRHGDFLQALIEPVNGFIILDLHNVYCQLHNFSMQATELLNMYPLHLVREIHISGGSWDVSDKDSSKKIRRDTHDDAVPREVFELLHYAIDKCTHCKYVVMEQIGTSLAADQNRQQFYKDFLRMEEIVQKKNSTREVETINPFIGLRNAAISEVLEDNDLFTQQRELAEILENSIDCDNAIETLQKSSLAQTAWQVEQWRPEMIDTAMKIAKKWKRTQKPH